ncbi:MAG: nucleotidyltransferase domain-containing protein [Xanthomonadales bacterium]|nr:nucleotidyltransferase domain-containing protein [Xanthomonadales bacterium]
MTLLHLQLPNMGMPITVTNNIKKTSMADALFSTSQQRVLAYIYGQPERSFYATELIRLSAGGSGAIQRELARLEDSGLVTVSRIGTQKHYQANLESPIYHELKAIVQKTIALGEPLKTALEPLQNEIDAAFIYGSVAKRTDHATSDIDLMIISDTLSYADVFGTLEKISGVVDRVINPTVYSSKEFRQRIKQGNSFIKRILSQEKLWIIGQENDIPTA